MDSIQITNKTMKKYRITISETGKYDLEFKKKGFFFEHRWKKVDYFFDLKGAKDKLQEMLGVHVLEETEWIKD